MSMNDSSDEGSAPLPRRIQRRRGVAGWKMPANTVYVGRPSRWGNPLRVGQWRDYSAADAVRDYKGWLDRKSMLSSFNIAFGDPPTKAEIRAALRGKNLCCWCKPGEPCHADVLLEIANASPAIKKASR